MSLAYDFDVVPIFGDDVFSGKGRSKVLAEAGIERNALSNYVASFRDPATAEALRGASDNVKALFSNAGFGFLPSGGKLPNYQIDPDHFELMDTFMNRIAEAHESFDDENADWNGFDFAAFIAWALNSGPAPRAPGRAQFAAAAIDPRKTRKNAGSRTGLILRTTILFAVFFVILWQVVNGAENSLLDGLREVLSFEPQPL